MKYSDLVVITNYQMLLQITSFVLLKRISTGGRLLLQNRVKAFLFYA